MLGSPSSSPSPSYLRQMLFDSCALHWASSTTFLRSFILRQRKILPYWVPVPVVLHKHCGTPVLLAVAVLTAMVLCHASSNRPKGLCCCRGCPCEWCGPCSEVLGKPLDHILPMVLLRAIQSCTSVCLHLADTAVVTLTATVYLYTTKCRLAKYSTCRIWVVD